MARGRSGEKVNEGHGIGVAVYCDQPPWQNPAHSDQRLQQAADSKGKVQAQDSSEYVFVAMKEGTAKAGGMSTPGSIYNRKGRVRGRVLFFHYYFQFSLRRTAGYFFGRDSGGTSPATR